MLKEKSDQIALDESKSIDITDCQTVCLTLGPYRNLTTLTAATLFLHPNCQVLNHAGSRIFGNSEVDFLTDFTKEKLDRFTQFGIKISTEGKKGDFGGSITLSHAFDQKHEMKNIHEKSGVGLLKKNIKSLFWKESLKTSILIQSRNIDLGNIFDEDERLRFLMPIRNPFDCALSNLKTGQASVFIGLNNQSSLIEVLQAILKEIHWFANLQSEYPERFFSYLEHEISPKMLTNLATFLKLNPAESWVTNATSAMQLKHSNYSYDQDTINWYQKCVENNFTQFPALAAGLLRFSEVKQ